MKGYIQSFETFATVDGPGIRFVVFLKGCLLRCKYCHNPDTWTNDNALIYEPSEIVDMYLKYKNYYKEGGITCSGGEPLLQIDFLIELFKLCKKNNIHTALDTSGIVFDENNLELLNKFKKLNKYLDLVLLDIKQIDEKKHIELTSKSNQNVLKYARFLAKSKIKIWIRYVLVPSLTDDEEDLKKTRKFISTINTIEKIEILPYHTLGISKYKTLNIDYPLKSINPPTQEEILKAEKILKGEKNNGKNNCNYK